MFNRFLNYFVDVEDQDPVYIRLARNILIVAIIATLASIAIVSSTSDSVGPNITVITLFASLLVEILAVYYVFQGKALLAKIIVPVTLTITITIIALNANSMHDISIIAYPLIIIIANLLQGRKSLIVTVPLVVGAIVFLGIADITGISTSPFASRTGIDDILVGSILIISGAGILNLLTQRLRAAIEQAEANELAQIKANEELKSLQESLELRVSQRTDELDGANKRNERRARQFEAMAQVARATAANEGLDSLLPHLARLISERFGFYHTGIFLLDEKRENAVLRAANSEGGKRMLDRKHKLQIGQAGIVGFVSATGTPRIALDVGADAVFFDNPDLPNTHSEMALPIKITGEIIGVLDVQSTEANAFNEDDIEILSTLADQVAIAIQNSRSYETMQELLKEAQRESGTIKDTLHLLESSESYAGYRASGNEVFALSHPLTSTHVMKAMESKQTVTESGKTAALAIPIRLRDRVIGVMDIHAAVEHEWDEDEVDIAEAVAERLSLAIETSLLLKTTQKRAELERITAEISGKIGASTQFDAILRTAAEELSQILGGSDVLVQIQPEEWFDQEETEENSV